MLAVNEKKPSLNAGQLRKKRIQTQAWTRALIQFLFFWLMPGAFVAGFSGVKYIFSAIGTGQVIVLNSFVKALIFLILFTMLFGRYFCGYVCAFGSLGDFVYKVSQWVQKKVFHRKKALIFPKKLVPYFQKIKYCILAIIIILCTAGIYASMSGSSPWDVFSRLTAFKTVPAGYTIGIILFAAILIGMALQERFFCQFLCPMGALFALLPIFPWSMLQRKKESCIKGCNICANQCPVGIKIEPDGIRNGECIGCDQCIAACPRLNITHHEQKFIKSPIVLAVLKATIFFVCGLALGLSRLT